MKRTDRPSLDELMEAGRGGEPLFMEISDALDNADEGDITPEWFNAYVKEHYGGIVYLDRETVDLTTVEGDGYWLGDEALGYVHYIPSNDPRVAVICAVAFLRGVGECYSGMASELWNERNKKYNTSWQRATLLFEKPDSKH